jgi:hypothetical protein
MAQMARPDPVHRNGHGCRRHSLHLSNTVSQVGSGLLGLAAFAARAFLSPDSSGGGAVSLKLDHVSMTAGGRLAGRIAGLDQGRANAGTAMSLL